MVLSCSSNCQISFFGFHIRFKILFSIMAVTFTLPVCAIVMIGVAYAACVENDKFSNIKE